MLLALKPRYGTPPTFKSGVIEYKRVEREMFDPFAWIILKPNAREKTYL